MFISWLSVNLSVEFLLDNAVHITTTESQQLLEINQVHVQKAQ